MIDKFDARILSALQESGRLSWSRLAERINLSASACQRRVERDRQVPLPAVDAERTRRAHRRTHLAARA